MTLCVLSCGELTLSDCKKSLDLFAEHFVVQEVSNVYPQVKALNQMVKQCNTEFLVPVDGDFILDSDAGVRINKAVNMYRNNPQWHSILFNLYDTLTERKILALKILRTSIAKENLFSDTATPDVEHYKRLTDKGHTCVHAFLKQSPIGRHVVRGHHFCYNKYRDVYQTYRANGFEWDSGVFLGGDDFLSRVKAHFDFFFAKWIATDNEDYLSCIAGMMDGILSPPRNKSKTLDKKEYAISNDMAYDAFMEWWLKSIADPANLMS